MSDENGQDAQDAQDSEESGAMPQNPETSGVTSVDGPVEQTAAELSTVTGAKAEFGDINDQAVGSGEGNGDLGMIMDIPVQLTVELGRTRIPIKEILQLAQGSVIELDTFAGEPMDVLVNGCLIAHGEVVVSNERFGIRLTDIVTPSERIGRLNKGR